MSYKYGRSEIQLKRIKRAVYILIDLRENLQYIHISHLMYSFCHQRSSHIFLQNITAAPSSHLNFKFHNINFALKNIIKQSIVKYCYRPKQYCNRDFIYIDNNRIIIVPRCCKQQKKKNHKLNALSVFNTMTYRIRPRFTCHMIEMKKTNLLSLLFFIRFSASIVDRINHLVFLAGPIIIKL